MEVVAIIYFFVVILGLGYSLKKILKLDFEDNTEKLIFIAGLGLALFVLLCIPLALFHGLIWYVFLLISLPIPIYAMFKTKTLKFPTISINYLIIGLITLVLFIIYLIGAFSYPYLADDDSWIHSTAAKYISIKHTYFQPEHLPIHYLEPYPPFYASLMGVLHQLHQESIQFILKFFNVLLIALGLPLAYIWLRRFCSEVIALLAVFLLAILPCFMSHFIWAQTLALILWFPALYAIERSKQSKSKNWLITSTLIISTVFVVQPSCAAVFGVFLVAYFLVESLLKLRETKSVTKIIKNKELKYFFLPCFSGLLLAVSIFWIPEMIYRGYDAMGSQIGFTTKGMFKGGTMVDTSQGKIYGILDFVNAPLVSKMDQATGLGIVIFGLLLFSIFVILYHRKKLISINSKYLLISLLWLIISVVGIEGNALPYKLLPHRFWVFFAIPVAILVAFSIKVIYNSIKKDKITAHIILSLIFISILFTSGYPKFVVQTSQWPPGVGWTSKEQIQGYINLKELEPNTLIYSLCKNPKTVIGMDKMDYPWVKEIEGYKKYALNDTLKNNYNFLKKYDYSYLIVDTGCAHEFGINQTNLKLQQIINSPKFKLEQQVSNNGFFLFKIL